MKKFIVWASIVIIILLIGFFAVAYAMRDLPPEEIRKNAWAAIGNARREEAAKYSEDYLIKAESAYRLGLRLAGRESARLFFLRDFDVARSRFEDALHNAELAAESARGSRESLKFNAESSMNKGRDLVQGIDNLRKTIRLDEIRALKLRRGKIALHEAQIYYRAGEYADAAETAEKAIDQLENVQEMAVGVAKRYMDRDHIQKWKRWISETIEHSRERGTTAIIVDKLKHMLSLYQNGERLKSYKADLGFNFINDKFYAGDNATPEGKYKVIKKKGRGQTIYYKALLLNYPNHDDWQRFQQAKNRGYISKNARIGGMIEIHGEGGKNADWTKGCVALSNKDMDELFALIEIGTPVTIVGSADFNREFTEFVERNGNSK
ncbi:MAG: L,D-transpeptidase [Acidobacteriota bacterium]